MTNSKPRNIGSDLWYQARNFFRISVVSAGSVFAAGYSGSSVSAQEWRGSGFLGIFPPESCIGKIDWSMVGFADGEVGIEAAYFSVYEQLCARRSKTPDKEAYFSAYKVGNRIYCRPENIYRLARGGWVSIGACENSPRIDEIIEAVQRGFADIDK